VKNAMLDAAKTLEYSVHGVIGFAPTVVVTQHRSGTEHVTTIRMSQEILMPVLPSVMDL
jgi:hypothetical protein